MYSLLAQAETIAKSASDAVAGRSDNVFLVVLVIAFVAVVHYLNERRDKREDERREKIDERNAKALEAVAQNGRDFAESMRQIAKSTDHTDKTLEMLQEHQEHDGKVILEELRRISVANSNHREALLALLAFAETHVMENPSAVLESLKLARQHLSKFQPVTVAAEVNLAGK